MEFYIARQPILNHKKSVVAYELLFRNGLDNHFTGINAEEATKTVITTSLLDLGINKIVKGKKAFINFTKKLIKENIPALLPKQHIVIEILEDVEADNYLLDLLSSLKNKGYTIAVDDFVFQKNLLPFIELADILKIDFMELPDLKDREKILKEFQRPNLKFLAEKVETVEDFETAKEFGYSLFQGYFFSKPKIISGQKIAPNKLIYMQLMLESCKPEMDFRRIEEIFKKDVDLPLKLLKYINSPFFGFKHKIDSIKHALALLGEKEFKRWVSLIALSNLTSPEDLEITKLSLIRSKFFELIGSQSNILAPYKDKLFITGIFSTLDAILKKPMNELIEEFPIADDIKDALIGKTNILSEALAMAKYLESTIWEEVDKYIEKYKLTQKDLFNSYADAIEWAENILAH